MSEVVYKSLDFLGFPGYQVGSDGSVWSCRKQGGPPKLTNIWKQLSPNKTGKQANYRMVQLCRGSGKSARFYVHHLVLAAFIGPRPDGMEAIHKNDIQSDNRACNLEWGTHKRNCEIRKVNGKDVRRQLIDADIVAIRTNPDKLSRTDLAEKYKVSVSTITDVIRLRTWKDVVLL